MIRMRHSDPNVRISVGARQEDGAYFIPMDRLDDATAHGFYICHTDSDRQPDTEAERGGEPLVIEAPIAEPTTEAVPALSISEDDRIMAELQAEEEEAAAAAAESPPEPVAEPVKIARRRPAQ